MKDQSDLTIREESYLIRQYNINIFDKIIGQDKSKLQKQISYLLILTETTA